MTQTIKIKRSTGSSAPSTLAQGELAYSKGSDTFYVGDPSAANTPIAVGGAIKNNAGSPVLATGVTAAEIRTLIDVDQSGTDNSANTNITVTENASTVSIASSTGTNDSIAAATTTKAGVLTATDKVKLNGIESSADVTDAANVTSSLVAATSISSGNKSTIRTNLGLGSLATKSAVGAAEITDNSVGADELNVSGDGSSGQYLRSDGDGSFTWATVTTTDNDVSVSNLETRLGEINSNVTIGNASTVHTTTSGNLTVTGNLTVSGTTTTVNAETVNIADNFMLLNSDQDTSVAGTEHAGLEVNRGSLTNVQFRWSESADRWQFSNDGSTFENIPVPSEYTNNSGDITSVGAGTGLSGGGSTGAVTLAVDLSELPDMTSDVDRDEDEIILLDNGADRRKLISEIPINAFRTSGDNDLEFEDQWLKLNQTSTITNQNGGIYVARAGANNDAIIYWDETDDKWKFGTEGYGNSIGVGDITGVTLQNNNDQSPADTSIVFGTDGDNSAAGTSGDLTFRMAVGTIDGGTY